MMEFLLISSIVWSLALWLILKGCFPNGMTRSQKNDAAGYWISGEIIILALWMMLGIEGVV